MTGEPISDVLTQNITVAGPAAAAITLPAVPGLAWEILSVTVEATNYDATSRLDVWAHMNGSTVAMIEGAASTGAAAGYAQSTWAGSQLFPPDTQVTIDVDPGATASQFIKLTVSARVR